MNPRKQQDLIDELDELATILKRQMSNQTTAYTILETALILIQEIAVTHRQILARLAHLRAAIATPEPEWKEVQAIIADPGLVSPTIAIAEQ